MAITAISDEIKDSIITNIANELTIEIKQVINTLDLLENGNTVPFIARYRKEVTGSLDESQIRIVEEKYNTGSRLYLEKERVIENIRALGKLTPELENNIRLTSSMGELQEIYSPYKKKKKTRGMIAREKGLERLATIIKDQMLIENKSVKEIAETYINKDFELINIDDVLSGARDIIAEDLSNSVEIRKLIRDKFFKSANFVTEKSILYQMEEEESQDSNKVLEGKKYSQYFKYEENAFQTPPHRLLAMVRGDREGYINFKVIFQDELIVEKIKENMLIPNCDLDGAIEQLELSINDGWKRLLGPSMQRELRRIRLELAEIHSVNLFTENLKHLILTPPIKERILGIDPAYRTGCKYAAIDETGRVLKTGTIYPHEPHLQIEESRTEINGIINSYNISIITIGNGTASRETEHFISELVKGTNVKFAIVNEAGASVYSASDLAREEFPDLDVTIRGAISIARRFQDPLAELVKIDPSSLGVGQYQHDLTNLSQALKDVVIDTVNLVGVDVNTASEPLLRYVSGITRSIAKNIIEYRKENGAFVYRNDLNNVKGIGSRTYEQCAGFLRIFNGPEPFDNSPIHPESYKVADELLNLAKCSKNDLVMKTSRKNLQKQISLLNPNWAANKLNREDKVETISDIIKVLQNPYRDPRDDFDKPLLKSNILSIEDLNHQMEVEGTITNIVDFGAFVDIGVKTNGLIHISEISDEKFIKHPRDAGLKVGDIIKARVLEVDIPRKRISLSMKKKPIQIKKDFNSYNKRDEKRARKDNFPKKPLTEEDKKMNSLFKNGKIQL